MLVNNAGLTAAGLGAADDERDVLQLSPEHFMGEMRINALGPMLLARGLLPALRRSTRPRIVNISSQIGSMVVSSTMGRDVGYGASKAALNMITVKLAWRLRDDGVIAVAIHPGYLRTAMSGPGADLDPADAAVQIVDLVDALTIEQSGTFLRGTAPSIRGDARVRTVCFRLPVGSSEADRSEGCGSGDGQRRRRDDSRYSPDARLAVSCRAPAVNVAT